MRIIYAANVTGMAVVKCDSIVVSAQLFGKNSVLLATLSQIQVACFIFFYSLNIRFISVVLCIERKK